MPTEWRSSPAARSSPRARPGELGGPGRRSRPDQLPAPGRGRRAPTSRGDARGERCGNGEVRLQAEDPVAAPAWLTAWALERRIPLAGLEVRRPSLEDVYLELTAGEADGTGDGMSGVALALHQFRFDQKIFWRNPASVFFTVMFPVMFLVIFDLVFGGGDQIHGLGVTTSARITCRRSSPSPLSRRPFQNLAMSVTIEREGGILKRGRGTPLPDWVFFAGRIGNSLVVSLRDARPAGRDRADCVRRPDSLGPAPRGGRDAGDRRRGVLLLSASR